MRFRRLPIESAQPLLVFAIARLAIAVAALLALVVLGFPYGGEGAAVVGGLGLPWAVWCLLLARRAPERLLSPLVPAADLLLLLILELVAPEAYGAVRFTALFLIAAHAHFQGERRGVMVALLGSVVLVVACAVRGDYPLPNDLHALYETVFVIGSIATGVVVGTLRTAESASRLRARSLSRRTIQAEAEVRRRVSESIHDGPVQELIGLDMMLSSARKAAADGRTGDAARLLDEARELTERNIRVLRDELLDLGPYAFEELSFATAIENCMDVWKRRYGIQVLATIEQLDLPPQTAGLLFGIAQEAIVNAGRHSGGDAVSLSLRAVDSRFELRVTDNGSGFDDADPLGSSEPGHLGLAMMRERAALLERTPRGIRLTQAGSLLVEHAEAIAQRLSAAQEQLEALASLETGRLRLAAFPTAVATVVAEAVAAFDKAHPSVALTLEELLSDESADLLRAGQLDLALIVDYGQSIDLDGIELHPLIDDPMFITLPQGHRLAEREKVPVRELRDEFWIEGKRPYCNFALEQLGAANGFEPQVAFEAVDWIGKQGLVAAGVGVSLVPGLGLAMLREDIVVRRMTPDAPKRRVSAAVAANGYTAPAVPAMLDILREECARQEERVERFSARPVAA